MNTFNHNQANAIVSRRFYGVSGLLQELGWSRTNLYNHIKSGEFPQADYHIGQKPVWLVESVLSHLNKRKEELAA